MATAPKRRVSRTDTVAAPTGGIDDTSPVANMDPHYAIEMMNLFPRQSSLQVRPGYRQWTTGLPGPCRTLISYEKQNGSRSLFAMTSSGVYDITSSGVAGASVRACTNGYVSYTIFANISNQFLVVVNGSSDNYLFDGTTYYPFVFNAAPAGPGQFNGIANPSLLNHVCSHKRRLWFVEQNSTKAWYTPVDAVAGTLTVFLLGSIFKKGGYLRSMFTWTRGAGDGIDDVLVFVSSNGEMAGYVGTDPSTAATWNLEAVFYIGSPLTTRSYTDLGGDMAVLNVYGVQSMQKLVAGSELAGSTEAALSQRISRTLNDLINSNRSPNWEIVTIPALQCLVLVVPATSTVPAIQYVMNMLNGSWTTYDLPMLTCTQHQESWFFSDFQTNVYIAGNQVYVDNVNLNGTGGIPILSGFMQAYNDFGDLATDKHYNLVRPIFNSSVSPAFTVAANADYGPLRLGSLQTPSPITTQTENVWDRSLWDQAVWTAGFISYFKWCGVSGVGYSAALLVKLRTSTDTEYVACNWVFEPGVSL